MIKASRKTFFGTLLIGFLVIGFVPSNVAAQTSAQSFVKSQYYLGAGGTPPSLQTFAQNPRAYLRHEAAYQRLKEGFEQALGTSLTDAGFQELLASGQVRLERCSGSIMTAGIYRDGMVSWKERSCYSGEYLIQLQTSAGWMTVASQGCFNLVRGSAPPQPRLKVTHSRPLSSPKVYIQETYGTHIHTSSCCGIHNHGGCGPAIDYVPGTRAFLK